MTTAEDQLAPPEEELEKIAEAATQCWDKQASFRLLNAHDSIWHGMAEPGVHYITVDTVPGVFDANQATFVPDDWTELNTRLRTRLAETIGAAELPVGDEGSHAVDWTTCEIVEDAPPAIRTTATSQSGRYTLTLLVTPEGEAQVEQYELAVEEADDAAGEDGEDAGHGITAQYLGDYYGSDPLEFEGMNYVVDWTTWEPDQITDDGRYGSEVTGLGSDGNEYELYVWFDLENGALIARAIPAGADEEAEAADEEIADPQAHFDEVLSQQLRDQWASKGSRLPDGSKEYDVSAWVNGEYGGEIEFTGHDGQFFYATLTASTVEDEPKRVKCSLRIKDADDVVVESEEVLS